MISRFQKINYPSVLLKLWTLNLLWGLIILPQVPYFYLFHFCSMANASIGKALQVSSGGLTSSVTIANQVPPQLSASIYLMVAGNKPWKGDRDCSHTPLRRMTGGNIVIAYCFHRAQALIFPGLCLGNRHQAEHWQNLLWDHEPVQGAPCL